jgi:hypothetical protein
MYRFSRVFARLPGSQIEKHRGKQAAQGGYQQGVTQLWRVVRALTKPGLSRLKALFPLFERLALVIVIYQVSYSFIPLSYAQVVVL